MAPFFFIESMGKEIERKFLVNHEKWHILDKNEGILFRQGYLFASPAKTIRVRIADDKGFLTIKGATEGITRSEFEYEIPRKEAEELLEQFADTEILKHRYFILDKGNKWEVDVFLGENEGLILAEIELESENEELQLPNWIDIEVSLDSRYYNANLIKKPYRKW